MSPWFSLFCHACVLSFGLLAGVFLAFSDFIMRSLSLAQHTGGVEVMQIINREVFRYVFMILFIGMAPASVILTGYGLITFSTPGSAWIALAGVTYLLAAFGVTVLANVPMNEALAQMDLGEAQTLAYWQKAYLPRWTFWNSLRTIACLLAAATLLVGLNKQLIAQVG